MLNCHNLKEGKSVKNDSYIYNENFLYNNIDRRYNDKNKLSKSIERVHNDILNMSKSYNGSTTSNFIEAVREKYNMNFGATWDKNKNVFIMEFYLEGLICSAQQSQTYFDQQEYQIH